MAKYICSARYMYISVETYQYFSGNFCLKMMRVQEVSLSLTGDPPPDPQRSFTTDGDSNYKETSGCHSSPSCLFVYLTNFTITNHNNRFAICADN